MNSQSATDDEPIVQTVSEPLQKILQEAAGLKKKPSADQSSQTLPFHPLDRQPLATLTILDDGSREDGETIRIRKPSLIIGREKGDVTLPFDNDISSQHAELKCQYENGKYRWFLIDLASTNGTFLRAYRATLAKKMELMLGSRRYLYQLPQPEPSVDQPEAVETNQYQAPARTQLEQFAPKLSEIGVPKTKDRSFALGGNKMFLGRDTSCEISIPDDLYLSPKHARFSLDKRGRWMIEDRKSVNGIWIRVKRIPLQQQAEFQLGQQRFCFRPHISQS